MIPLVSRGQPQQNLLCLGGIRLIDLHPSEPALQGGVFLDVGAELLIGGGADELQFPPGQNRLQDIGRVDGAFGRSCAHNGVELVHKKNRAAVPHQLFQQVFKTLLKIAPVFGARHQAGHIQREQTPPFEGPGHSPLGNPLGQPFGQGGFAHAGFPHQTGVVLLPPAKDLDHPFQLGIPAKDRVQFPL